MQHYSLNCPQKALKTVQLMFIISIHDIPSVIYLQGLLLCYFQAAAEFGSRKLKLADVMFFHGLTRVRPFSNISA